MLIDLPLPSDNTMGTRIEWAHCRLREIEQATLPNEAAWFVWNVVVGWLDLCSAADHTNYKAMAKLIEQAIRKREG